MWLSYAGEVEARFAAAGRDEDELAFLRDARRVPQPAARRAAERQLRRHASPGSSCSTRGTRCCCARSRARATRASPESPPRRAKEVAYHVERSGDWVIRLGDGTDESHARMQAAIDDLWMYTGEMFAADAIELALIDAGIAADVRALRERRGASTSTPCSPKRRSRRRADAFMQQGGKQGVHTEHLGHLLAEMQFLQRAYPGAQW